MRKIAILSFSGGIDSTTLLIKLLYEQYEVFAYSFFYGQKHKIEIEKASIIYNMLKQLGFKINHHIINFDNFANFLFSSLVSDDLEVPEGHYHKNNMESTVVPNRNKIFISFLQAIGLSFAKKYNSEVCLSLGAHKGDLEVYPDCTYQFFKQDYEAFLTGNWDANMVKLYLPFLDKTKLEILKEAYFLTDALKIDFNEIYCNTFSSYKPVIFDNQVYSDYKSATSIERIKAFNLLEKEDPAPYADENGKISFKEILKKLNLQ